MTIIEPTTTSFTSELQPVTVDIVRDIHKGIRAELFAVTAAAGSVDPADVDGRVEIARHVADVVTLLVQHAEHEEEFMVPAIHEHLPQYGERIVSDHARLDDALLAVRGVAEAAASAAAPDARFATHRLYLDLAAFTGEYLAHQDFEERVVEPALERAIGPEGCVTIVQQTVGSIGPDEMAASLAVMIPAMNIDDRTELLGGMQAGAPAEVFAGVWSLVRSVLPKADADELGARLGV